MAVLFTEGRAVGLRWEHLQPKGPKGKEGGCLRSFTAIRKNAGLFCESFLRKGKISAYVGLCQIKDLKDPPTGPEGPEGRPKAPGGTSRRRF